jgi:hypothetical protein
MNAPIIAIWLAIFVLIGFAFLFFPIIATCVLVLCFIVCLFEFMAMKNKPPMEDPNMEM